MLIPALIVNFIDVIVILLLTYKLTDKKIFLTVKNLLIVVVYGLFLGMAAYFLDGSRIYQLIGVIATIFTISLIAKRTFDCNLLIYGMYAILLTIVQLPIVTVLSIFQLELASMLIIGQLITFCVMVFTYMKIPIYKLFRMIEVQIWLKFCIYLLGGVFLVALFNWNFEYVWYELLIFLLILLAILTPTCKIIARYIYHKYTLPREEHDYRHSVYGLVVKAYQKQDMTEIAILKNNCASHQIEIKTDRLILGESAGNIVAFIESKQEDCAGKSQIIHDVCYLRDHRVVGIEVVVKMLNMLLDNAIETETTKPIIVEVDVNYSSIRLFVSNEFYLSDPEAINRIFTVDGYTTKKETSHGHGIDNLYREVTKWNGKIIPSYGYNEIGSTYYLSIEIEIY